VLAGFRRITLFGRDQQRLEAIAHLCGLLCQGEEVEFDLTTELSVCVDDEYEILFNQMRFGGMLARDLDEKLALRHSLVADETLGIVGVTNAVRTLHGLKPLLETLQRKRRPYTLVNFTNPCSIVTQYMVGHWGLPAVGICDYPEVLRSAYARLVGAPRDHVELRYFGVNHFGFIYDVLLRNVSIFDQVKARLDECALAPAYHRAFSSIVIPSWDLIFDRRTVWERQRNVANRASFLYALEQELAEWVKQRPLTELEPAFFLARLSERNCDWYDLIVTPVLANLLGQTSTPLVLNLGGADVLSLGCAPCVLETNAVMGPAGHRPVPADPHLASSYEFSLVRQMKRAELELLEACLGRTPEQVLRACLMNPMIQDHHAVRAYLDDAIAADPLLAELMRPSPGGPSTHALAREPS
jgi:6-phospho-beta-glucosidase